MGFSYGYNRRSVPNITTRRELVLMLVDIVSLAGICYWISALS